MSLEEPPTTVSAVPTLLPPFWPAHPLLWFLQAEAQFSRRGIAVSRAKYEEILCALPTVYAAEVEDLLFDPPEDNPYEKLKDQLILRITDLEHQKILQNLTAEELGDRKPTQLLRKMRQLLVGKAPFDSSLLRQIFLQRLPSNVQAILLLADEMNIDKVAEMADRIMDVAKPIVTDASAPTGDDRIRRLIHEEVNTALRTQQRSRRRSFSNSKGGGRDRWRRRSTSRGRSSKRQAHQDAVCWYHARFGRNARKCRPPCSAGNAGASR